MENKCIIHYTNISFSRNLIQIQPEAFQNLLDSKASRIRLGGENLHFEQCNNLPPEFSEHLFYHRECRIKFNSVKVSLKRKLGEIPTTSAKRSRRSESTPTILFPDYCMICSKKRITVKKQIQRPSKIVTLVAENKIKSAATLKKDFRLLGLITDVDLIAKEFQKHQKCYTDYTRIVCESKATPPESNDEVLYEKGDYLKVCKIVDEQIIGESKCISLNTLLQVYGITSWPKQYRSKLKLRLTNSYGNQLLFINAEPNEPQVVISKECLNTKVIGNTIQLSDNFLLKKAAVILKDAVLKTIDTSSDLPWPPTVKSLEDREPPDILQKFYDDLLKPLHVTNKLSVRRSRLVKSFCSDIMFAISKGKYLMLKQVSLGLGLHSITGLKSPIVFLNRLGHSISYDQMNLIETAQAELSQHLQSFQMDLPLIPDNDSTKVPTIFWWDNFDRNIETTTGAGSIHNTPGIVFQEKTEQSIERNEDICIPYSKRRSVSISKESSICSGKINPKTNPPLFIGPESILNENILIKPGDLLKKWKVLRFLGRESHNYPRFAGWVISHMSLAARDPTVMTYIPPIQRPITDYGTIFEIFRISRKLAEQSNMNYTHITFDLGAAVKAYQVIWNNPAAWKDIIIHLGDFHAMMAFFGVIGKFVKGSGFEEITYQADLCTSGSIGGVLSGKQYNRCWMVHEIVSEALDNLFIEQYLPDIPSSFLTAQGESIHIYSAEEQDFMSQYSEKKKKGLNGELGKTTQYWMQYVRFVDQLHQLHLSIKSNDFHLRLRLWDELLPLCFVTNRLHYSRYGSYYVKQLKNLDNTHPGAREEVEKLSLSVRRNKMGVGQAVDLAGEQTYMKNAKTPGGVTMFANSQDTVSKWVLNRPFISRFVEAIDDICDVSKTSTDIKKCLRPAEISKSNEMVKRVVNTFKMHFINPFDPSLDCKELYNVVSGAPASSNISSCLLNSEVNGGQRKIDFESRLVPGKPTEHFYSTLSKYKFMNFEDTCVKTSLMKGGKSKEIAYQRDILGILVSESYATKSGVDMERVLTYPLAPVSIPLCTPDGNNRKTAKSTLFDAAIADNISLVDSMHLTGIGNLNHYFLDVIAYIRIMTNICGSIRDLAWKIVNSIPVGYQELYLVCDTYKEGSIKTGERKSRGHGKRYVIKNPDMKIPSDFLNFLKNGDNKSMLLDLIEQALLEDKNKLNDRILYFSNRDYCRMISKYDSYLISHLASDHEEADTKLIALVKATVPATHSAMIRSPSGDIDIILLFLLHDDDIRVFIDNGTGNSRKIIDIHSADISKEHRRALIGMHAFSGNDYVSSFFKKGKKLFWKTILKTPQSVEVFANLGKFDFSDLEKFICLIYGFPKESSVNQVRTLLFTKRFYEEHKPIDLSNMPPCFDNLQLHSTRANYVSTIFQRADHLIMGMDDAIHHGWNDKGESIWTPKSFPDNIADLLLSYDSGNDDELNLQYDEEDEDIGVTFNFEEDLQDR